MPRCAPCTVFADSPKELLRTWPSRADMVASARAGCDLCTLGWQYTVYGQQRDMDDSIQLSRNYHDRFTNGIRFEIAGLATHKNIHYDKDQDSQRPLSANDVDTISQARRLLAKCISSHGECSNIIYADDDTRSERGRDFVAPSNALQSVRLLSSELQRYSSRRLLDSKIRQFLPRRLLDLSHGPEILLINVEAYISDGTLSVAELSQYCTLSYRWGVTTQSCILEATFPSRLTLDADSMPRTFQDAITVARGLDVRFLWIDALCIVQPGAHGDDTDWNEEGPHMGAIYHNAVCTIAATCADDVADGFLSKVDSERIRAVPCKVNAHLNNGKTLALSLRTCKLDFFKAVTCSALNKRGWVTQERFLSRRILHFTMQGIIWECHKTKEHGSSAVSGISDYRPVLSNVRLVRDPMWGLKDFNAGDWMEFVSWYSETDFTVAEDRLVALSSLSRLAHRHLGYDDAYHGGMWRNNMLEDLLWYRRWPPSLQMAQRLNIAPTWSWASLVGRISYWKLIDIKEYLPWAEFPSVQVLDVISVPTRIDNPYGNVKEGRLKLLAQALAVFLWTGDAFRRRTQVTANGGHHVIYRSVYWDEPQDKSIKERQYQIIPMCPVSSIIEWRFDHQYAALIVEPASSVDVVTENKRFLTYRRIGLVVDSHGPELLESMKAEGSRYNFGKAEQDMETLVLV